MSEKKTFKDSEGVLVYENMHAPENSGYWCFAGKMFPTDEWDMEVTFTKKPKPIKLDQMVTIYDEDDFPWVGHVLWFNDKHVLISQNWGLPKVVARENIVL